LTHVEVNVLQFIVTSRANHFAAEPFSETGFVVNASTIAREIRDYEFRLSDRGNNLIVDIVVVLLVVDPQSFVSGRFYARPNRIVDNEIPNVSELLFPQTLSI
jgi:hypothetical protein